MYQNRYHKTKYVSRRRKPFAPQWHSKLTVNKKMSYLQHADVCLLDYLRRENFFSNDSRATSQHNLNCSLSNFAICSHHSGIWNVCTTEGSSSSVWSLQCACSCGQRPLWTGPTAGRCLWPHTSFEACPSGGRGHRPSIMASRSSPLLLPPLAGWWSPDSVNSPMILASSALACWSYYTELS